MVIMVDGGDDGDIGLGVGFGLGGGGGDGIITVITFSDQEGGTCNTGRGTSKSAWW